MWYSLAVHELWNVPRCKQLSSQIRSFRDSLLPSLLPSLPPDVPWERVGCRLPVRNSDTAPVSDQVIYMRHSRVETKGYSVTYFDRIAAFKAPYRWTSAKGGAHTCLVDAWISNKSMECIWAPHMSPALNGSSASDQVILPHKTHMWNFPRVQKFTQQKYMCSNFCGSNFAIFMFTFLVVGHKNHENVDFAKISCYTASPLLMNWIELILHDTKGILFHYGALHQC